MSEIEQAVRSCGSDKAPGPDGFTFKFIKVYWDRIKDDIMAFVKYFEQSGKINTGCNSSFISLIPKCRDPLTLKDYRPVNLIGCMYKILSKVLSVRLKSVMSKIISQEQMAYIDGRSILDGPLILNELISWAKKCKRRLLFLKSISIKPSIL